MEALRTRRSVRWAVRSVLVTVVVTTAATIATTPLRLPAASAAVDPVIAAAGDIACDPSDANYNGGAGTATFCRQRDTGALLDAGGYAAVLPLGDLQYTDATLAKLQQVFDPTWGTTKAAHRPVPGNHEYLVDGAAGYYDYYGAQAGERGKGWYSYDVGSWHLIALNGEAEGCPHVSCSAGSEQETWLRADLAAHPAQCTLAYWHVPKFTSSAPDNSPLFQTFWQDLYTAGVDVVLNGHFHNYERFGPQNPAGAADANGIREFVVGTGGKGLVGFGSSPVANSQVRNSDTYGVLEMTLHNGSYDWSFQPVSGQTFTDTGTATCTPAAASPTPTPTVSASSTASATASPSTASPTTSPTAGSSPTTAPTTSPTTGSTPTSDPTSGATSNPSGATTTPSSGATSLPSSTAPATAGPSSSPDPTTAPPSSSCDPSMQLSGTDVPVGRAVGVIVSGVPPGASVSLEGYTRPSTTYRQLRAATPAATDGTVRFTLQPTTNSRLRPRLAGCASPGTSQVVTVHAGLSLRITRTGTRQYTFGGAIVPAAPNIGRQVTLFYRTGAGTAVRRAVTAVRSDGTYEAKVRFAGSARLTFFWQTGNNLVNAAATSTARTILVS